MSKKEIAQKIELLKLQQAAVRSTVDICRSRKVDKNLARAINDLLSELILEHGALLTLQEEAEAINE